MIRRDDASDAPRWTASIATPRRRRAGLLDSVRNLSTRTILVGTVVTVALIVGALVLALQFGAVHPKRVASVHRPSVSVGDGSDGSSSRSGLAATPTTGPAASAAPAADPLSVPISVPPVAAEPPPAMPQPASAPMQGFTGSPDEYNIKTDVCGFFADARLASLTGWATGSFTRSTSTLVGACGITRAVAGGDARSVSWALQPASSPVIATMLNGSWGPTVPLAGLGDRAVRVDQPEMGIVVVVRGDRALVVNIGMANDTTRAQLAQAVAAAGVAAF